MCDAPSSPAGPAAACAPRLRAPPRAPPPPQRAASAAAARSPPAAVIARGFSADTFHWMMSYQLTRATVQRCVPQRALAVAASAAAWARSRASAISCCACSLARATPSSAFSRSRCSCSAARADASATALAACSRARCASASRTDRCSCATAVRRNHQGACCGCFCVTTWLLRLKTPLTLSFASSSCRLCACSLDSTRSLRSSAAWACDSSHARGRCSRHTLWGNVVAPLPSRVSQQAPGRCSFREMSIAGSQESPGGRNRPSWCGSALVCTR